jgi:hypothetical protein
MSENEKGEWAEVAEEGIVPESLSGDADVPGGEAVSDEPATSEGVDLTAGDRADATTDGGSDPQSPDLRDAAGGPRQADIEAAD